MSIYEITNGKITLKARTKSAELMSLVDLDTGREYIWNANPKHWGWSSPILFPQVGACRGENYTYEGKQYPMPRHGLARHREFQLLSKEGNELWFSLKADEDSLKCYPFLFELRIGYVLQDKTVKVVWQVANQDDKTMYYSIGGHPAFNCPLDDAEKQTDYSIWFHGADKIISHGIDIPTGLAKEEWTEYPLEQEHLAITADLFDQDALVIENQVHQVSLVKPDGRPYLTVAFDAPLFGVWAPIGGEAPFVCIEPWYGRCDSIHYTGDLAGREYGHTLQAGDVDEFFYEIKIEQDQEDEV